MVLAYYEDAANIAKETWLHHPVIATYRKRCIKEEDEIFWEIGINFVPDEPEE